MKKYMNAIGFAVTIALTVLAAGIFIYLDPPPNPKAPTCRADEIPIQKEIWYCVPARKP